MQYNPNYLDARTAEIDTMIRDAMTSAVDLVKVTNAVTVVGDNVLHYANTRGILAGATITHASIPANTYALSVAATSVTLSARVTATIASGQATTIAIPTTKLTTAVTASGAVLPVANVIGLHVGMGVTGTNIPANSRILSIQAAPVNTITLAAAISGSVASGATLTFVTAGVVAASADTASGTTLHFAAANTDGIIVGQKAAHANIPATAVVSAVDYATGDVEIDIAVTGTVATAENVTFSLTTSANTNAATTFGSDVLSFADASDIAPGMTVAGTNIPASTTVTSVDETTDDIVLSQPISGGNVSSGGTITFGFGVANVFDGAVLGIEARSPTIALVGYKLSTAANSQFPSAGLRELGEEMADNFTASSDMTFALSSIVAAGNSAYAVFQVTTP